MNLARRLPFHYGWVVVAVTGLSLLTAAAVRAAPGMLLRPLEAEFGWDRASISLAVALSLLVYGLGGPLAGTMIDRFGPTRVLVAGMATIVAGLALMVVGVREMWQFALAWGLVVAIGTGAAGSVIGATVANRWFRARRGLVIGLFGAATSAGQLVFLPSMMQLTVDAGWRSAMLLVAGALLALLVPVALLLRDRPGDVGLEPVGGAGTVGEQTADARGTPLRVALKTRDFWLLAGSFFICGYTSNGLIGTHLIAFAAERGFTEVTAASAVGLMGMMNAFGTIASGWLSDRYDNRKLLAGYYGFRALSIAALPLVQNVPQLFVFAVVYGLDWIATVPPTANLVARIYGRASLGTLYGWIFFGHMVGSAAAAYAGGFFRQTLGDYTLVFVSAALVGFTAMAFSLSINPRPRAHPTTLVPAPAG